LQKFLRRFDTRCGKKTGHRMLTNFQHFFAVKLCSKRIINGAGPLFQSLGLGLGLWLVELGLGLVGLGLLDIRNSGPQSNEVIIKDVVTS